MPDRLNVLHVRDSGGMFGAERVILTLVRNIDRARFNVTILAMHRADARSTDFVAAAKRCGIPVVPVAVRGRFDLKAIRAIRRAILTHRIHIVHSHDFKANLYAFIATIGLPVARITTSHGSTRDSLLKRIYLWWDERMVYRRFHHVIAVSAALGADLHRRRIRPPRLAVIPNGLDFGLLAFLQSAKHEDSPLPQCPGHLTFAVVGRLFPDKGHRFFLDALARLRDTHPAVAALIVGDGPDRDGIASHIQSLGLQHSVFMCGFRSDMEQVYRSIDCLVVPSLREGLPYVVLEAMAAGVPVIASEVGDIPRLIENGVSGHLVQAGDVEALHQALYGVATSPAQARAMADAARERVLQQFSARAMVDATQDLYRTACRDRGRLNGRPLGQGTAK